jgi:integrase
MAAEAMKEGLWLRALVETAYTYGWRKGELIGLQMSQLDMGLKPTMRLYDSKNGKGRVVPLMSNVYALLSALCEGKGPNEYVFTREDGSPVKDFPAAWQNMCIRACVPCPDGTLSRFECTKCGAAMEAGTRICST